MPDSWTFTLITFGIVRLSYMIALEEGPFGVCARLRGQVDPEQRRWTGRGIRCALCVSFWLSILGAFILPGSLALNIFGLAGASMLLLKISTR